MKTIFVLLLLFGGYTLQKSNNYEHPIKVSIELPDTVYYVGQRNIPIILKIENTTSKVLLIRHPNEYGYIFTTLKRKEIRGKGTPLIMVSSPIKIKEYETLKISISTTLDNSYSLDSHSIGKHDIYIKYYYELKKKKIFRKNKGVVDDGFVTSNVFTFYLLDKEQYFSVLLRQNLLNGIR